MKGIPETRCVHINKITLLLLVYCLKSLTQITKTKRRKIHCVGVLMALIFCSIDCISTNDFINLPIIYNNDNYVTRTAFEKILLSNSETYQTN